MAVSTTPWPALSARPHVAPHRSCAVCAIAQTAERGQTSRWKQGKTWERVLRYPGGQERRIRYPAPQYAEEEEQVTTSESVQKDWWGIERYYHDVSSDEEDSCENSQAVASTSGRTAGERPRSIAAPAKGQPPKTQGLPSTPDELLRYISSKEYKAARAEQLQQVRSSYQLLEGSPWVQTKPLFVLATQHPGSETGLTFTLRTRVQGRQAEDEVSKVLGRRRPDGSSVIRVEELRDGIVAFEEEADAHRFASLLEADGTEAVVAQCDGHELFRESQAVRAIVVLIRQCSGLSCHLPMPEELASALRGQRSLEDADL